MIYTLKNVLDLLDADKPDSTKIESAKTMIKKMREEQPAYYLKSGYMGLKHNLTAKAYDNSLPAIKSCYVKIKDEP